MGLDHDRHTGPSYVTRPRSALVAAWERVSRRITASRAADLSGRSRGARDRHDRCPEDWFGSWFGSVDHGGPGSPEALAGACLADHDERQFARDQFYERGDSGSSQFTGVRLTWPDCSSRRFRSSAESGIELHDELELELTLEPMPSPGLRFRASLFAARWTPLAPDAVEPTGGAR